ncbi:hypothetical protein WJX72_005143 [[Myrmecia] bisecta]|uniref:Non-specific serine/threonine protein kinase n=1 Tax=[Myrmecia] bisecta TaxID=41462 RepID=A0AAW1R691_9CHLO
MNQLTIKAQLEALINNSSLSQVDRAEDACNALVSYIGVNTVSAADQALVASLVLDTETGIPAFIKRTFSTVGQKGDKARQELYKCLASRDAGDGSPGGLLAQLGPERADRYGPLILDLCFHAFRHEADRDRLARVAKGYQRDLERGKLTSSVEGEVLETLGLILEADPDLPAHIQEMLKADKDAFPRGSAFDAAWLLQRCHTIMKKKAGAGQSKEHALTAGALAGLSSALSVCQPEEGRDTEAVAFELIKKYLQEVLTMQRYQGAKAALRMLTLQAPRLSMRLYDEAIIVLDLLTALKTAERFARNRKMRDVIDPACAAFLHQLSIELCAGVTPKDTSDRKDLHSVVMGRLTKVAADAQAGKQALALAVQGLGEMAAPTAHFYGQKGVLRLVDHLAPLVQQATLVQETEDAPADDRINNEICLLEAYARVMAQLDTLGEAVIQQCMQVAERIASSYAIVDALRTLDLEYHQAAAQQADASGTASDGAAAASAEIGSGLVARNLADMRTFINLTAFASELLPALGSAPFRGWGYSVIVELVAASRQRPLLSGFYHLLQVVVRLAEEGGMFEAEESDRTAAGQADRLERASAHICRQLYREFALEVLVAARRYTDELLSACLALLLSAPPTVLAAKELVAPLQAALTLGLQYVPLAETAIAALERWERQQAEVLRVVAPQVVPYTGPYLGNLSLLGQEAAPAEEEKGGDSAKEAEAAKGAPEATDGLQGEQSALQSYHSVQANAAAAVQREKEARMQGLQALQPRIQAWLGRIGDAADALVTGAPADADAAGAPGTGGGQRRWDRQDLVCISVPVPEMQAQARLSLDLLIPQAAELAEKSADRATRVAACEFLHAATLWMIGTNAGRPLPAHEEEEYKAEPTMFHAIMQRLFPVLLRLASSAEPVAQQLFEPLMLALVHWLTRAARREAAETMALLEAILAGLADSKSGAQRSLCANAAREFFKWAARHMPTSRQGTGAGAGTSRANNLNATSLLRRLFDRLAHPEPYQRLGAAAALARCAPELGQEPKLADVADDYLLEALSCCLGALRMAEQDADGTGTKAQICDAIQELSTVVLKRTRIADALKVERPERAGFVSLAAFLEWLWQLMAARERRFREIAMWLHTKLSEIQMLEHADDMDVQADGSKGWSAVWLEWHLHESGGQLDTTLQEFTAVPFSPAAAEGGASLADTRRWLQSLEARLHWAIWALDQGIIQPHHLCAPAKPTKAQRSAAGGAQQHLVAGIAQFLQMVPEPETGSGASMLPGCDRECKELAFKLLTLLYKVLGAHVFDVADAGLHRFLLAALLAPQVLGIPTADESKSRTLALHAKELLEAAATSEPALLQSLRTALDEYLSPLLSGSGSGRLLISKDGVWEWGLDLPAAAALLHGLTLVAELKVDATLALMPASVKASLPAKFLTLAGHIKPGASPQAAEGALNLAINLGLPPDHVLATLLDPLHGATFYEDFRAVVYRWVLFNAGAACAALCAELAKSQQPQQAQLVAEAVLCGTIGALQQYARQTGRAEWRQRSFVQALLPHLPQLQPLLQAPTPQDKEAGQGDPRMTFLRLLGQLLALDPALVLAPSQPSFHFILQAYLAMLQLRAVGDTTVRLDALRMLGPFLTMPAQHVKQVADAVTALVTDVFPARSQDVRKGSSQATQFALQLMAIMDALVATSERNLPLDHLLEAVLPVISEMGEDSGHLYQSALETRLALMAAGPWKDAAPTAGKPASAANARPTQAVHATQAVPAALPAVDAMDVDSSPDGDSPSSTAAAAMIQFAWSYVFEKPNQPTALRRAMLQFILIPCLHYAPLPFQIRILAERAAILTAIPDTRPDNLPGLRGDEEAGLMARMAAYQLMRYMYQAIPPEDIKTQILAPVGGNVGVMKKAAADVRGLAAGDVMLEALAREVRGAAWACSAALVAATQDKAQYIEAVLKPPVKGSDDPGPWRQLLDESRTLSFAMRSEGARASTLARVSRTLRAVKERHAAQRLAAGSQTLGGTLGLAGTIGSLGSSLASSLAGSQLTGSQPGLADSQLGGPITGMSSLVEQLSQRASIIMDEGDGGEWQDELQTDLVVSGADDALLAEDDELDRHPCMLALVRLVEKAAQMGQAGMSNMPAWMSLLFDAVESDRTPLYIRLFLTKMVVHVDRRHQETLAAARDAAIAAGQKPVPEEDAEPSIFGRYATSWFPAMVDVITGGGQDTASQGMHYLLVDVCLTFLGWRQLFSDGRAATLPAEIRPAALSLMHYMVTAAWDPDSQVRSNNFNLIKVFVSKWRAAVPLPPAALLRHLEVPMDGKAGLEQRRLGMLLLETGLRYGQGKSLLEAPKTTKDLFSRVIQCLEKPKRGANTAFAGAAGECAGVLLAAVDKLGIEVPVKRKPEEYVRDMMREMYKAGDYGRFLRALERASAFYPAIVPAFQTQLLDAIQGKAPGLLTATALDVLRRHAAAMPTLLVDLRHRLEWALTHPNTAIQAAVLRVLEQLLPQEPDSIAGPEIEKLLPHFTQHYSADCRRHYFAILRDAWGTRPALHDMMRPTLLGMLGDPDPVLREDLIKFWHAVLPKHAGARLQALLNDSTRDASLWTGRLEAQWAQSAAVLLLELPRNHAGYKDEYFASKLAECTFNEYPVNTWGKATMAMAPIFSSQWAASLSASQSADGSMGMTRGPAAPTQYTQVGAGMVRATQRATQSQTVSLSLALPPSASQVTYTAAAGPSGPTSPGERTTIRRRFDKSSTRNTAFFGQLQRRRDARAASAAARGQKVTLMREYRRGELPDIQRVSPQAFLAPLGVLARREGSIAGLTVQSFMRNIFDTAKAAAQKADPNGVTLADLRAALVACFERGPRAASYVATLQAMALADRGVVIPADKAAAAALASGSLHAGALQMEEQILFAEDGSADAASRRRVGSAKRKATSPALVAPQNQAEMSVWSAIADVYGQLGADQLVHVVYATKVARCPGTRAAMQALTARRIQAAFTIYEALACATSGEEADFERLLADQQGLGLSLSKQALLDGVAPDDVSQQEEDLWYKERTRCMEALGQWEDLMAGVVEPGLAEAEEAGVDAGAEQSNVDMDVDMDAAPQTDLRLFAKNDQFDGTPYLRLFVRSCLFQSSERGRLASLLKAVDTQADRMALLQEVAPVELTAQAAVSLQWDRAQAFLGSGWATFRSQWATLHPLSQARRFVMLAMLQPLAEVQEILELLAPAHNAPIQASSVEAITQRWQQRWPSLHHTSADACLTLVNVRAALLDALQREMHRTKRQLAGTQETPFQAVCRLQAGLMLGGAVALERQGFLDTAQDVLAQHRAVVGAGDLDGIEAQLRLRVAQVGAAPSALRLHAQLEADMAAMRQALAQRGGGVGAAQRRRLALLEGEAQHQLSRKPGGELQAPAHLSGALDCYMSAASAEHAKPASQAATGASGGEAAEAAAASLKLALFCNELLQAQGAGTASSGAQPVRLTAAAQKQVDSDGGLAVLLVRHTLQALHLGGQAGVDAQLYVPRLLALMADSPMARQAWEAGWQGLALHVLLPWAAQMLSLLDTSQGSVLLPALKALAAAHPQRLYFPFQLSRQHYSSAAGKALAAELEPLLRSPLMEAWAAALNDTTFPAQRWQGWQGELNRLLEDGRKAEAVKLYQERVYPDMISNHKRARGASARGAAAGPQTLHARRAGELDKSCTAAFGADGAKLRGMDGRSFLAACRAIAGELSKADSVLTGKRDLASLSPWLAAFNSPTGAGSLEGERLLLPSMPSMQSIAGGPPQDIHIVGFGKTVDVFSSKQKPKKLTIYGSDFRTYEWIVKGGEELRIDQRVEQLFDVMNGLMQRHPGAAAHSLQVRTYDVVPVTPSLGLVAFVPGTKPLKAVVTEPGLISDDPTDSNNDLLRADAAYAKGIASLAGIKATTSAAELYEAMFQRGQRSAVVKSLEAAEAETRWDALREALLRYAGGPEEFLAMRATYTTSLAAVSMCGYIAGSGDRHSDNFLVDLQSGTLVPIDFGYSFGTANQVLPIPELMPFRLTRQMTGALQPHDPIATLQAPATLAMAALRQGHDILEGILGVFLREPLADWQREARILHPASASRQSAAATATSDSSSEDIHINLKVELVRQKLQGQHPSEVTIAELATKHGRKKHWPALQQVVRGDTAHNARARIAKDSKAGGALSVEDQVESLLDQATDPNVLGRAWQGWRPWL